MNADKIRGKIAENRMSITEFCSAAGFARATFDRKMRGDSEFDRSEIERIITVLHLTDDETRTIFFEDVVA
jgi:hypothetical protein